MPDIVALLQCLQPFAPATTLHQFSRIVSAMLAMSGRVTMLGLSRWAGRGGSYRTVQRFFYTVRCDGWAWAGSGPSSGSPALTQNMCEKNDRDRLMALAARHPEYALGFQDEVWWSRVTQPHLHAWAEEGEPDPKALACYGLLVSCPAAPETLPEQVWLRFVGARPISPITTHYLAWCCAKLAQLSRTALLMIWDNASWHISHEVRNWIRDHNGAVKQQGQGVRIVACYLPSKSPWLNPIEPHWVHGKRNLVEPARLLTAQEAADRVCTHFGCKHESHLTIAEKVA